jgi:hypothetical protein
VKIHFYNGDGFFVQNESDYLQSVKHISGVMVMKRVKKTRSKVSSEAWLKENLVMMTLFPFLAIAVALCMAAMATAQSPPRPPTLEEERIIQLSQNLYNAWQAKDKPKMAQYQDEFWTALSHYKWDVCKKTLPGDWVWYNKDVTRITYDEKFKVFLGNMVYLSGAKDSMDVKPGYLLFKANYFKEGDPVFKGFGIMGVIDINWLRQEKHCRGWGFKGTEYSFKEVVEKGQKIKKPTETTLRLTLEDNELIYQVEKDSYTLTRDKIK